MYILRRAALVQTCSLSFVVQLHCGITFKCIPHDIFAVHRIHIVAQYSFSCHLVLLMFWMVFTICIIQCTSTIYDSIITVVRVHLSPHKIHLSLCINFRWIGTLFICRKAFFVGHLLLSVQNSHIVIQHSHIVIQHSHIVIQHSHIVIQNLHIAMQHSYIVLQHWHIAILISLIAKQHSHIEILH